MPLSAMVFDSIVNAFLLFFSCYKIPLIMKLFNRFPYSKFSRSKWDSRSCFRFISTKSYSIRNIISAEPYAIGKFMRTPSNTIGWKRIEKFLIINVHRWYVSCVMIVVVFEVAFCFVRIIIVFLFFLIFFEYGILCSQLKKLGWIMLFHSSYGIYIIWKTLSYNF